MQDHVTGGVADSGVLVGGGVILQPKDFVIGVLSGSGLLVGDGSKCGKHVRIHGNRIVQKVTNNFLDKIDGLGGNYRRVVRVVCPLDGGTIYWFLSGMGGVLWLQWDRVLELMEGGGKIIRHGDVTGTLVIILVECESAIAGTGPVNRNGEHCFEGLDEMVGVFSLPTYLTQKSSTIYEKVIPLLACLQIDGVRVTGE